MTTDTTPLLSREEVREARRTTKHPTELAYALLDTALAAYDPTGTLWSDRAREAEENYERAADAYYTKDSELASAEMRIAGLEKALEEILAADDDFRARLPPDWDVDPLTDACIRARAALAKEQSRG